MILLLETPASIDVHTKYKGIDVLSHIKLAKITKVYLRPDWWVSSPDWWGPGSIGWVSSHKPKGHWFDFHSGHMPGLQARSLVGGVQEATNQCFSRTLMLSSLPSPLSKK